jgi:hypothetical protein
MGNRLVENKYIINYKHCIENNFENDVQKAIKFYLELGNNFKYSEDDFGGFVLYPKALIEFLRIMEIIGESRNIIILPWYSKKDDNGCWDDYSPAYIILKIGNGSTSIESINTKYLQWY